MSIRENIIRLQTRLKDTGCRLIAVSKTYTPAVVQEAYDAGQRTFGENKVQELMLKQQALPKDIEWHMIGHLQSNKVKQIAPFIHLIHSVDSLKLLREINKEGAKNNRLISCLLQIYIANEDTKFGLSFEEAESILKSEDLKTFSNIRITGFMGMATNTDDQDQIRKEFRGLKQFFEKCKNTYAAPNVSWQEVSMGMSSDYSIAVDEGSTMIRVGSLIFGKRI